MRVGDIAADIILHVNAEISETGVDPEQAPGMMERAQIAIDAATQLLSDNRNLNRNQILNLMRRHPGAEWAECAQAITDDYGRQIPLAVQDWVRAGVV